MVQVIDVGTTKVVGLVAEMTSRGEVQVAGAYSVPNFGVQRGVVTDLERTSEAIRECVQNIPEFDFEEEVVVAVCGGHLESINSQGFLPIFPPNRPIHHEDVLMVINHSRQVTPSPDREQVLAVPREFRVDGQRGVRKPVGMTGSRLEVLTHLVTGQIAHLNNLDRCLEMAGLRVSAMLPAPVACGLALLTPDEREMGTAIVDIGAGTTGVAVFSGGTLATTASIPVAGSSVTSDLSKLLKMSPEDAEKLKVKHGRAIVGNVKEESTVEVRQIGSIESRHLQRRVLYEIVHSRMKEIAELVKSELVRSGVHGVLPGGVVLTGGTAQMPGVVQLFAKILNESNVRIATPTETGDPSGKVHFPEYAVAFGLAHHALDPGHEDVAPASGFGSWKDRIKTFFQLRA